MWFCLAAWKYIPGRPNDCSGMEPQRGKGQHRGMPERRLRVLGTWYTALHLRQPLSSLVYRASRLVRRNIVFVDFLSSDHQKIACSHHGSGDAILDNEQARCKKWFAFGKQTLRLYVSHTHPTLLLSSERGHWNVFRFCGPE